MPPEKVVFATAVEALFVRALGANLSSLARRRLSEAGLDLEKPLAVSYPLDDWKTFVHVASGALYSHLTPVEAHWWMGIHFMEGYLQTFTGRIVAELAPALGPRRMLERIGQDLRSGNNFSEVELVGHSPRHYELWMNDVLDDVPSFAAGFILRAQQLAGARGVHVDVASYDGTACTFDIRWREALPQAANG
ncbi:uncharacterized protein (TIGR02265 family) [Archangium gephyra]|uniref:Uncharacterized protein (TIGR02265 family) n=1 Tax=Archangium gephyra TaxID=48 RepID=A0ABX9K617_9BACT|nr:DUF2378 family protein [Archangium gephyra]REG33435.1 uncharacterized protein (TIGR02265 family) [Archangium gephyra]